MRKLCIHSSLCFIALFGLVCESRSGEPPTRGLDNRGLITYYGYTRPERLRQDVQELDRQRQQSRDALYQTQAELDRLDRALKGYSTGRGLPGLREAEEPGPTRLRAAGFNRRGPYYPF